MFKVGDSVMVKVSNLKPMYGVVVDKSKMRDYNIFPKCVEKDVYLVSDGNPNHQKMWLTSDSMTKID